LKILGISAFYHDSAVCLIEGDRILYAAQEERFSFIIIFCFIITPISFIKRMIRKKLNEPQIKSIDLKKNVVIIYLKSQKII
jgi:predicted NodU family carbamoyl transferase